MTLPYQDRRRDSLSAMWLNDLQPAVISAEEVAQILQTDESKGLSNRVATERLHTLGHNELVVSEEEPIWRKYLEQFKNPLIVLLLCSAIVSLLMRQLDDAASITLAIVIVVTVGFIQEYRSEQTLEKLKKLVPPVATCIRDGREDVFEAKYLVPGDLVKLGTGDRVPADIRLLTSLDVCVDESSLTGETEPVSKHCDPIHSQTVHIGPSQMKNIVFMGTMISTGHGTGLVVATGEKTQFGQVFRMMSEEESPTTPLQNSMNTLGKQLSAYSFVVIVLIMIAGLLQGKEILSMFNIGVSLAVAAIPEGLPIVTTVTLALGVMRMAKRQAIVKKLPTVEALGCVNVICSDKTGTITCNQMTVTTVVTAAADRVKVSGMGYTTQGRCDVIDSQNCEGTLADLHAVAQICCLCNNANIGGEVLRGQPTEGALLTLAGKITPQDFNVKYPRKREIPFNHDTKSMSVICESLENPGTEVEFLKGALESVLARCSLYLHHGMVHPISGSNVVTQMLDACQELGQQGLRVIALARSGPGDEGSGSSDMVLVGLAAMQDPPRHRVPDSIQILANSGVRTLMLTGDAKETAIAIGKQIGLVQQSCPLDGRGVAVAGAEIDRLGEEDMRSLVKAASVFYRVTPRHKVRIVKALQWHGFIVAMTGDGVNDGVAVKSADVGISMGHTGSDVCKEASDVILLDDDFSTIMAAIEEGKSIFYNIRNFVQFQMSTSIAALSLITLSTLMDTPNPLNPMQILWINIIMDGPPAQSLGVEPADKEIMKKPPRNTKEAMLSRSLLLNIILSASIIVCGTLYVFKEMMEDGKMTARDTTMTFTCFVFFDMFNALSCRSPTKSVFSIGLLSNTAFCYAVLFSLLGQMLVIYAPPLQYIFQTEALALADIMFLVCITSSIFIFSESKKFTEAYLRNRNKKRFPIRRSESAKSLISLV